MRVLMKVKGTARQPHSTPITHVPSIMMAMDTRSCATQRLSGAPRYRVQGQLRTERCREPKLRRGWRGDVTYGRAVRKDL